MKYNIMKLTSLTFLLGAGSLAMANEVTYVVNKPFELVYQVAHQNPGHQPVLGARQTIHIDQQATLPVDLKGYQLAGIVTDNVDGHELPLEAKQFGQWDSCTVSTDSHHTGGTLTVTGKPHEIKCSHT